MPRAIDSVFIQNITTNSTSINWSSIQANETNGILLGYKVMLTPGNHNWTVDEKATSIDVVNLDPNTEYEISIVGYNINGEGEIRSVTFKTKSMLLLCL